MQMSKTARSLLVTGLVCLLSRRATTLIITPPAAFAFGRTPDWARIESDSSPMTRGVIRSFDRERMFQVQSDYSPVEALEGEALSDVFFGQLSFAFFSVFSVFDSVVASDSD